MAGPASLVHVVETIRIAVAPVFLLTGLGALLSVTTGRHARVIVWIGAESRTPPLSNATICDVLEKEGDDGS